MIKKSINKKLFLLVLFSLGTAVFVCVYGVLWAGGNLGKPAHSVTGEAPADLSTEAVSFSSESGTTLQGWFLRGQRGAGTVILMHAIRGNRRAMLGRARFISKLGYSVFLFDFQAHGESHGEHITFGYWESYDAQAAVQFVRSRVPNERIAVIPAKGRLEGARPERNGRDCRFQLSRWRRKEEFRAS